MLKYIIAFSIICFCDSTLSAQLDNTITQIIFIQRYPITILRSFKRSLRDEGRTRQQADDYLRQKAGILMTVDPTRWIIDGVMAMNSTGHFVKNCTDAAGNSRVYDTASLSESFRNELKTYWPSTMGIKEESVWEVYYKTYGSCINFSPLEYYQNSIKLYNAYNVGELLRLSGIVPGKEYEYYRIATDLARTLSVLPYIKCESFEDGPYLLEVHICLDAAYELATCSHGLPDFNIPNINIHYPNRLEDEQ